MVSGLGKKNIGTGEINSQTDILSNLYVGEL